MQIIWFINSVCWKFSTFCFQQTCQCSNICILKKMHWFVLFTCRCKIDHNALLVFWGLLIFTRYTHRHEKAFQSVKGYRCSRQKRTVGAQSPPLDSSNYGDLFFPNPDPWSLTNSSSNIPKALKFQGSGYSLLSRKNSGASANYFPHWPKGEVMNSAFKDRNHRQMGFSEVTVEPGVWSCATVISDSIANN